MNVSCPECRSTFRVDPAKVPEAGVRARCSVCGGVLTIVGGSQIEEEFAGPSAPDIVEPSKTGSSITPAASTVSAPLAAAPEAPRSSFGSRGTTPAPSPMRPTTPQSFQTAASSASTARTPSGAPSTSPATPTSGPFAPAGNTPSGQPLWPSSLPPRRAMSTPLARPAISPSNPPPLEGSMRTQPPRATSPVVRPSATAMSTPAPSAAGAPSATPTARVASRTPTRVPINPFLANDPNAKARRLARALISDLVTYFPQKREEGLREGTLKELFQEELKKSYEEFVDQVGKEFADSTQHFQDAVNDILGGGRKLF